MVVAALRQQEFSIANLLQVAADRCFPDSEPGCELLTADSRSSCSVDAVQQFEGGGFDFIFQWGGLERVAKGVAGKHRTGADGVWDRSCPLPVDVPGRAFEPRTRQRQEANRVVRVRRVYKPKPALRMQLIRPRVHAA